MTSLAQAAGTGTSVLLDPPANQEINDGVLTLAVLTPGFGDKFRLAVLADANPPQPADAAVGGYGAPLATALRVRGTPVDTINHHLFVDAQLTRLGIYGYNDTAVANAFATAHEVDVAVSAAGNDVAHLTGVYVVMIPGSASPVSGRIRHWKGVWSDTLQGSAVAPGLTIDDASGIYASRPYRTGANITVTTQYSLAAEEGTYLATDASGGRDHCVVIADAASGKTKALRNNNGTLEVVNDAFNTVILQLDDTGTVSFGRHLVASGSGTPTVAVGAGAGSGATASATGNDVCGFVSLLTGTGASAGLLATITFANAYGSAPKVVMLTPANQTAVGLGYTGVPDATKWTLSGAPASSTQYFWFYQVLG